MNFKGDLKKLGTCDIAPVVDRLLSKGDEIWTRSTWRQEQFEAHTHTQAIDLIFDRDGRHQNPTTQDAFYEFEDVLRPVLAKIANHYNNSPTGRRLKKKNGPGYFVRVIFTKLLPGGIIPPHGDDGFSLMHAHRVHVPLISDGMTEFTVGNTTRALGVGEIWEINNRKTHSVHNKGENARVHMIADWVVAGERCCCGKRLRPKGVCTPKDCHDTDYVDQCCTCLEP